MATMRARTRTDGSTMWQVRWRDPFSGREAGMQVADRAEANRWAMLLTSCNGDLNRATEIVESTRGIEQLHPLEDAARLWIDLRSVASAEGRARNWRMYRNHIEPGFGRTPIEHIDQDKIRNWLLSVTTAAGKLPSDKSVKNWHSLLSSILSVALEEQWIARQPAKGLGLPRRTAHLKVKPVFLSPADLALLVAEMTPKYRPLVELLARTGMRWGEATALTVADVNLRGSAPTINVDKAIKEDEDRQLIVGPPKTERAERVLDISDHLAEILRPIVTGRPRSARLIAPASARKIALDHQNFSTKHWARATARCCDVDLQGDMALPARPRIHDLRHSHASWLVLGGIDLPTIQARLGHESITTTIDRYGHLSTAQRRRAATVIDEVLAA